MNEVRVETTDGVMTVTLVDVENRNALGAGLVGGLLDAIAAANADPAVRAIVITNEGSTFCAGANLKERSAANDSAAAGASRKSKGANAGRALGGFETLLHEIQTSPTPVIGKIKGHVVGGGNGLAAAVDISIAVEDVKFGFTEVRLPRGCNGGVPARPSFPGNACRRARPDQSSGSSRRDRRSRRGGTGRSSQGRPQCVGFLQATGLRGAADGSERGVPMDHAIVRRTLQGRGGGRGNESFLAEAQGRVGGRSERVTISLCRSSFQ
ncbi:MAG: enoyl-CoA hydratase/isomerase family protein [Deltaproteobacteria bacterium]|nr:enoyl-CoA hydratase/isomerase family protein [Deltaproteobacteria bacterium]